MLKHLRFSIVATLLLLQPLFALPPPPAAETSPSEESKQQNSNAVVEKTAPVEPTQPEAKVTSPGEWSAREKLLFFTLEEFTLLSNFTVERGTTVFRNVLKDATLLKEPNELLQAHLAKISHYVTQAERIAQLPEDDKVVELYDMVVRFTEIVEHYNTTALKQPTTEDLYMEASLKKNGLDQLQVDFLERFLSFSHKFENQIQGYLNALSEEELLKNEAKMIDWYNRFKSETDGEKKVEIFAKFFDLYS